MTGRAPEEAVLDAHTWFIEHRIAFATRTLEAAETRRFEGHLQGCAECREEVARMEYELRWLPMAAAPVSPPPAFRRRAVDHVLGRAQWRRSGWLVPVALAASLLLAVGGWLLGRTSTGALRAELRSQRALAAALRDTLSIMQAGRVLQADLEVDGSHGGILIFADARTHRWNVVIHGLPPAAPGHRYQFWFVCADGSSEMVRGSEVAVDLARPTMFTTGMPQPHACPTVKGAALTEEPMPDAQGPPRGKALAHLML